MSEEIKKLKKTRSSMKAKLTQFETYLNVAKSYEGKRLSSVHSAELQTRLSRIESLYGDFDRLQTELELLSDPPDEEYEERQHFEDTYYQLVARARDLLVTCADKDARQRSGSVDSFDDAKSGGTCHHHRSFSLPKINIPQFNGSYQHWLEFRDTFASMIHNNKDLDDISKFHYLRASLQGSVVLTIQNIDFTSENYNGAWKSLCEKYDNSRSLVNNHVQALFNVNSIAKESSFSIRNLVDTTNKNIRALTILKQPTEHWDTLIIHMMASKLDESTSRHWEEFRSKLREPPTLLQFCTCLNDRADLLEALENKRKSQKTEHSKPKSFIVTSNEDSSMKGKISKCPLCNNNHVLYTCENFKELSIESRISKAKELKVCLNCLRPGHTHPHCRLSHCRYCKFKHNTLLHLHSNDETKKSSNAPIQESVALPTDTSQLHTEDVALTSNQFTTSPHVLLSTALVQVYDSNGEAHTARLLLDNGSTANFLTQDLCGKLGLSRRGVCSTVSGICNQTSRATQSCNVTIKSMYSEYKVSLNCLILPKITQSLPSKLVNIDHIPIPNHIKLADPSFNVPSSIDILVGAETFWAVICNSSIDLGKNLPKLYETKLGWLISGYVARTNGSVHQCHFINQNNDEDLTRFWELDTVSPIHSLTSEERSCEENFSKNTYRNEEGRFVVTMPLKSDPCNLGDSYNMAKIRFLSLERRFKRDPVFKDKYLEFMHEYEDLGHMIENPLPTSPKMTSECNKSNYYLPHHGVIRESSTTTKLRTVFDASAKTTSGLSLNDIQMIGPTIQDDLFSILIRFRQHKYVISGDIEKMYRAILVNPIQRPLQQIVFRYDPSHPLKTYTLNTVTYGTASAPYLATKCLTSLANTVDDDEVKRSIAHDFYVDDYLSGGSSKEEVISKCKGVISALSSAQFNLRKFRSNDKYVLNEITSDRLESNIQHLVESDSPQSKTLGLHWQCDKDILSFSINLDLNERVTKRHILSVISQIWDPLGLIAASVVESKLIMQMLWKCQIGWDEEVPENIKSQWTSFSSKLIHLNDLRIPRWILQDNYETIELHMFSNASERAYGACVYARTVSNSGNIHTQLIASKNRIAPVKPTTIPRLELCGALLGARLCSKIVQSLTLPVTCKYWCDSTIVLGWLSTRVNHLKQFVRNRVNEINELTNGSSWGYVPTLDNPADLVSRGVKADLISTASLWWSGPQFLQYNQSLWPKMPNTTEKRDLPELCHVVSNTVQEPNAISKLIQKMSNFTRLTHTLAYVQRFIFNCRNKQNRKSGNLTYDEIQNSINVALQQGQHEMFPDELSLLKAGKSLPPKNRLLSLSPFLDPNGLIRVGGRLDNSPYDYNQKHPILLCSKHDLTKVIFRSMHLKLLHAGPQLLLSNIRETYWPLGGRNLAKCTVKRCITCFRHKCESMQPIMGQLPQSRLSLEHPFLHCSVDYAGPVLIADKKGRGCKLIKSYLCIFVCLAVKAVHLELVTSLTAEAYMDALRRFMSRRGKPQTITSDQGTNFVGACNELNQIISNSTVQSELADQGIKFQFSPAYSPHFNGMAEAAVKSVKHHLRRILNLTHFTYEEMHTCLAQIEAILNSRPMTPLSTDPNDFSALTPAHFLIGRTLTSVPHPHVPITTSINLLQRHKRIEVTRQHFWKRFTNEYIYTLQQKTKWQRNRDELKLNSLVLIKDKTSPPLLWSLGRVTHIYPGPDGIARVANIKTKRGTIRRSWNNLCLLPLDNDLEDSSAFNPGSMSTH